MALIYLYDEVGSTNQLALEAAKEGAAHGECWLADRQTEGRGRRDVGGERREWFSPGGASIYMSVLLRPDLDPNDASTMTLAGAVGAAEALIEATDLDIWLKWPNDLYVGDRKVAGLLTEAQTSDDGLAVVAGLGVNVNVAEDEVPEELTDIMTSLRIEGDEKYDRMSLGLKLRRAILDRCGAFERNGMASLRPALEKLDRLEDRDLEIREEEDWVEGRAHGIDDSGKLKVEVDGEIRRMGAGEIRFAD